MRRDGDARPGFALALSGGGVRAFSQLGVLKAMARYGLTPDLVVGTSGGSIVAALYAAGRSPEEIAALIGQIWRRSRNLLDFNWIGLLAAVVRWNPGCFSGAFRGRRLEKLFAACLAPADRFVQQNYRSGNRPGRRIPLFITAVDLEDGAPMVFCDPATVQARPDPATGEWDGYRVCGRLPISRAVRASISIPGVFVPATCLPGCPDRRRCQQGAGDRYVDGGVREYLPLAVAVRLGGAGMVLGVNLGYAGMRREGVAERGIGEVVSQSLDIMGLDKFEESLRDGAVARARVAVLNPMIYDLGTFELEYLPQLVERGERLAEEFFRQRGLVAGGDPRENRRRLFPEAPGTLLYPTKGTDAYLRWKRQIKEESGVPGRRPRKWLPGLRREAQE